VRVIENFQNYHIVFRKGGSLETRPVGGVDGREELGKMDCDEEGLAERAAGEDVGEWDDLVGGGDEAVSIAALDELRSHQIVERLRGNGVSMLPDYKRTGVQVSLADAEACKRVSDVTDEAPSNVNENPRLKFDERATHVEYLLMGKSVSDSARTDHENVLFVAEPELLPVNHPSIASCSRHWSLNERQHESFVLLAGTMFECLLRRMQGVGPDGQVLASGSVDVQRVAAFVDALRLKKERMFSFLFAAGGCGKSRVIQCFLDFVRRWGQDQLVATTATTGIAAVLLSTDAATAETYFSKLKIPALKKNFKPVEGNEDVVSVFRKVGILIIDEISMASAGMLDLIERRCRDLKRSSAVFGGLHVLVSGDFAQLPAVGEGVCQLFKNSTSQAPSEEERRGWNLWRNCMTHALELTFNVRATADPELAERLERLRFNEPTDDDLEWWNQFCVSKDVYADGERIVVGRQPPAGTQAAVTDNKERLAASLKVFTEYLASNPIAGNHMGWRERGAIRIEAEIKPSVSKRESVGLTHPALQERVKQRIRYTQSRKFFKNPGILDLVLGAPMIITDNKAIEDGVRMGVANGTRATLVDVVLRSGAQGKCRFGLEKWITSVFVAA
jgi:hypothetical protein